MQVFIGIIVLLLILPLNHSQSTTLEADTAITSNTIDSISTILSTDSSTDSISTILSTDSSTDSISTILSTDSSTDSISTILSTDSSTDSTVTTTSTTTVTGTTTSTTTVTGTTTSTTTVTGTTTSTTTVTGTTTSTTTVTGTTTSTTTVTDTTTSATTVTGTTTSTSTVTGTTTSTITVAGTTTSTTTVTGTATSTTTVTGTATSTTTVSSTTTLTTSTTSTTTTSSSLVTLVDCDFANEDANCLISGPGVVNITDGSQFWNELYDNSEPPRAPLSDATLISESGSDGDCYFPYNSSLVSSMTNQNIWFCFEDQCPTGANNILKNCSSGNYALIQYTPDTPTKNVTLSVPSGSNQMRAGLDVQTLQYYYYITVYNDSNLDQEQKIQVYLLNNNGTSSPIHTITIANMTSNSWQNINVQIDPPSEDYQIVFSFEANSTNPVANNPIYFALDDILITRNANESESSTTSSTPSNTTSSGPNLGLILGLSLGLGIPALLGVVAGCAYYCSRRNKHKTTYSRRNSDTNSEKRNPDYQHVDDSVSTTFF